MPEPDAYHQDAAAYIHIPFCSAICPYCDFAVVAGRDDLAHRYIEAVKTEIDMSAPFGPLHAIYFGGGTPSHIDPAYLTQLVGLLDRHGGVAADAEVCLEANPEDFAIDTALALREGGFNRVSFGAQSLDNSVLTTLGRRHEPGQVLASVEVARSAGFENVSMDLIYGTPGETTESWQATLQGAIAAGPDHVSCYALTVEPGTPLGRAVATGAVAPDPDTQAACFEEADRALSKSGYERYEVSNWAKPGRECRYNMAVWAQGEYEAFGNGAHRFVDEVRSRNVRHLDTYLTRVEQGERPVAGGDDVTGWHREIDRLFVGLRRTVGVADGPGVQALLASPEGRNLLDHGVMKFLGGRLRVTRPLLTDEVLRAVLGLEESANPHDTDNL